MSFLDSASLLPAVVKQKCIRLNHIDCGRISAPLRLAGYCGADTEPRYWSEAITDDTAKKPARKSAATGSKLLPPKKLKEFPLQPHSTGKWQKRIHGKTYYFGAWAKRENGVLVRQKDDGRQEAVAAYNRFVFEQLHGKLPGSSNEDQPLMLGELVDMYLDVRDQELADGAIKPKPHREYKQSCDLLVNQFTGKRLVSTLEPADFRQLRATLAKKWGIERLSKFTGDTKMPFTWGIDEGKIKHLIPFGKKFRKPTADERRQHKEEGGDRMFTPAEIQHLLYGRRRAEGTKAIDRVV